MTMRFLAKMMFVVVVLGSPVQAEIFKCVVNGKTVFSDTKCGSSAEVIDVEEATKPTGTQFSSDAMKEMGSAMGKERRQKELDRSIERQQDKIDKIIDDYNTKRERLNKALSDHKNKAFNNNWSTHSYKREQYYEKKRQLRNEINETYRRYRSDKEIAYKKLKQLKTERRQLR